MQIYFYDRLTDPRIDQGQAGAQSIEDGAAIGILLQGLRADSPDLSAEIDQRFQAFETVRRERASLMQIFSSAGQDEAEKIRDEATKWLGDGGALKVPSECFHCRLTLIFKLFLLIDCPTRGPFERFCSQSFCRVKADG